MANTAWKWPCVMFSAPLQLLPSSKFKLCLTWIVRVLKRAKCDHSVQLLRLSQEIQYLFHCTHFNCCRQLCAHNPCETQLVAWENLCKGINWLLHRAERGCMLGQGQRKGNPTSRLSQNTNHGAILLVCQSRDNLFWIIQNESCRSQQLGEAILLTNCNSIT